MKRNPTICLMFYPFQMGSRFQTFWEPFQEGYSMGLTMRERHSIVRELAPRFQQATKKERSRILNQCVEVTGYTRCYAAYVLRLCGKQQVRTIGGQRVIFVPGHARSAGAQRTRRNIYQHPALMAALKLMWTLSD